LEGQAKLLPLSTKDFMVETFTFPPDFYCKCGELRNGRSKFCSDCQEERRLKTQRKWNKKYYFKKEGEKK